MTMHKALHPRHDVDYICKEKTKEEGDLLLKTTLTHQYNDLKTTYKSAEKDWLQLPETILTTQEPT